MQPLKLALAALSAPAMLLAWTGCGAAATSPTPMTARAESSNAAQQTTSDPAHSDPAHSDPAIDGQPAPTPSDLFGAIKAASLEKDAAAEEAARAAARSAQTGASSSDPEEGRPVSSGTCVGSPSRAAQKKTKGEAMCCYTPPSYFIKRVQAKKEAFRACYDDALKRRPDLRGRTLAKFVIEEDGSVAGACDAGSTVGDPAMVACVLRVFTTLTFDAYTVGEPCPATTLMYPMQFSPSP